MAENEIEITKKSKTYLFVTHCAVVNEKINKKRRDAENCAKCNRNVRFHSSLIPAILFCDALRHLRMKPFRARLHELVNTVVTCCIATTGSTSKTYVSSV